MYFLNELFKKIFCTIKPNKGEKLRWEKNVIFIYDNDYKYNCTYGTFSEWIEINKQKNGLFKKWYKSYDKNKRKWFLYKEFNFQNKKLHGWYNLYYLNGNYSVKCFFKNGKIDGLYETWYKNCQRHVLSNYKDGKKDGFYIKWNKDGKKIIEEYYKNGKKNGVCKKFCKDGKIKENNYVDGKKHGVCKIYKDEIVLVSYIMNDGKFVKRINSYEGQ